MPANLYVVCMEYKFILPSAALAQGQRGRNPLKIIGLSGYSARDLYLCKLFAPSGILRVCSLLLYTHQCRYTNVVKCIKCQR